MLNYRTDTFLRLRQEMDSLANQNLLTPEKVREMVKLKGIDICRAPARKKIKVCS